MGASGWDYLTVYRGTPQRTLSALHAEVFAGTGWIGAGEYESLEELWEDEEFMGEEGTHSILDIPRAVLVTEAPSGYDDLGTVRPLPHARLMHHFGTDRPTVAQYRRAVEGEELPAEANLRWSGRFVLLYTDGEASHFGVFGFSGD
ncbi:hypothetical protein [Kitasatospora sp. CB01950]|uniref:hypothetical protein n=1 Tax=Kitasatospora sp. CB01950 TaxID=1703930 RepID=UPI00093A184C|nr:hypothetical protein [Kitasatospora sp. CB01950]OKJ15908.1 hypothetical protein AMK19_06795 [Kitasatospora sp. CB01950]